MLQYTAEQKREHRRDWASKLRSGQYLQGKGRLLRDGLYCVLGVGCDAFGVEWTDNDTGIIFIHSDEGNVISSLPETVRKYYGLRTNRGHMTIRDGGFERYTSLLTLNDMWEWDFDALADVIESEPEGFLEDM